MKLPRTRAPRRTAVKRLVLLRAVSVTIADPTLLRGLVVKRTHPPARLDDVGVRLHYLFPRVASRVRDGRAYDGLQVLPGPFQQPIGVVVGPRAANRADDLLRGVAVDDAYPYRVTNLGSPCRLKVVQPFLEQA